MLFSFLSPFLSIYEFLWLSGLPIRSVGNRVNHNFRRTVHQAPGAQQNREDIGPQVVVSIFLGRPLFNHQKIFFVLNILVAAYMSASALLSHFFNNRMKGLRQLLALFRPHGYSDEYDYQLNFQSYKVTKIRMNDILEGLTRNIIFR
jgi:hypothetical protein